MRNATRKHQVHINNDKNTINANQEKSNTVTSFTNTVKGVAKTGMTIGAVAQATGAALTATVIASPLGEPLKTGGQILTQTSQYLQIGASGLEGYNQLFQGNITGALSNATSAAAAATGIEGGNTQLSQGLNQISSSLTAASKLNTQNNNQIQNLENNSRVYIAHKRYKN